ncbi:MAG: DUF3761 domain-containing protein [Fimbriimonadaceae bacterium]|nr:DUF3761 domain-containing protein [Fimbriimonadaceae bacterium]
MSSTEGSNSERLQIRKRKAESFFSYLLVLGGVGWVVSEAFLKAPSVCWSPPTALCRDGSYSSSRSRGGTCSWHGGVSVWRPSVPVDCKAWFWHPD